MHEILFSENILNLIGILLEIIGFIILLAKFKDWISHKLSEGKQFFPPGSIGHLIQNADEKMKEIMKPTDHVLYKEVPEKIEEEKAKIKKKSSSILENTGIPLVIAGLVFQGLSLFIHS